MPQAYRSIMSNATLRRRTLTAWTPAIVVPALVIAGVVIAPMAAGAVSLPEKTPAEVLAMIAESDDLAYSATIEKVANLGIPALPAGMGMPSGAPETDEASPDTEAAASSDAMLASALELVSGEHTARIMIDPEVGMRVQILDRLDERNIIVNADEAWLYDSSTKTATRIIGPEPVEPTDAQKAEFEQRLAELEGRLPADISTPAEAAQFVLDELEGTSTISLAENVRVADRAAYQVRVTPDDDETLIGSVAIAVDAETGLPLRVLVEAVGQDAPAFSLAITQLDLSTPDAALFAFTPPPGATVEEAPLPEWPTADEAAALEPADAEGMPSPTMLQSGWSTIVELPTGAVPAEFDTAMLEQFAAPVDGGFALSTALATVFMTDDGRVLVGTVPLAVLQAAAAR
jgi:outer membrane lipoprotein-sorting protein